MGLTIACDGRIANAPIDTVTVWASTPLPDLEQVSDTTTVPIGLRVCGEPLTRTLDDAAALACSRGAARRESIILYVRINRALLKFVDDTAGEAPGGFRYVGTIGDSAVQVVQTIGHEEYPVWILINAQTGRRAVVAEWPVISPDGRRFAVGGSSWDNCAEGSGASIEVWRFTATAPVREWSLTTQDCEYRAPGRWGAVDLGWRGPDTLTFTKKWYEYTKEGATLHAEPGRVVRTEGQWGIRIDSAQRPPS